jgi:hypothetical protein
MGDMVPAAQRREITGLVTVVRPPCGARLRADVAARTQRKIERRSRVKVDPGSGAIGEEGEAAEEDRESDCVEIKQEYDDDDVYIIY